jgi:hypothetical protein
MKVYKPNGPLDTTLTLREYPDDLTRTICHINIVKPYEDKCPAELALATEGINCDVTVVEETHSYTDKAAYAYVDHLVSIWDRHEPFINLEHDVAPWPGALDELWNCSEQFCRFRYPVFPPGRLVKGIGCVKFGFDVVNTVTSDDWIDLAWWDLDGQIISSVKGAGFQIHEHNPPVAHVRLRPFIVDK